MSYSETSPELLADAIVGLIGTEANWPAIPTDGARRAAELIYELAPPSPGEEREPFAPATSLTTAAPV